MRKTIIIFLISLFMVFYYIPKNAAACTDLLNAFLSVEKLNENVKKSLTNINDNFQRLDVALSQKNEKNINAEIGKLIDNYYDFYIQYYQNPPAQFIDDPKWGAKLSEVNSQVKVILKYSNQRLYVEAHDHVKTAYEAFSAIYKDRIPMQEQNVIDMIKSKIEVMQSTAFNSTKKENNEIALQAHNLKGLSERLGLFDSSNESYLKSRKELIDSLNLEADFYIKTPPTDEKIYNEYQNKLKNIKDSLEVFIINRKKLLNQQWFK